MDATLVGIDIGTSSCKGVVVDASNGRVLAAATSRYQFESTQTGYAEMDPRLWIDAAANVVEQMAQVVHLASVAAVGVTGQMRGPTFLGADGSPVRKSILWNDTRCNAQVDQASQLAGDRLYAVTSNQLNTMATLPKLLWLKEHEPHVWRDTHCIVMPKDYVVHALTGVLGTDWSDASGTSLFDIRRRVWSDELLSVFGLDGAKLPTVHGSISIVGAVTAPAAARFGLTEGTPVVAGCSDAVAEAFAALGGRRDMVKLRLGTSGAASWLIDDPNQIDDRRVYCWNYALPGLFLADVNTRSCSQSVDWFSAIAYRDCSTREAAYRRMAEEAATALAGSGGLIFRPHLQGEDAPFWDPAMTGSFTGLTARHGRPEMARAIFEGTAFALADAWTVAGRQLPAAVSLVGGGARLQVWTQIVADVLGTTLVVREAADAAQGAARLAGQGVGLVGDGEVAEAVNDQLVEPDPVRHEMYMRLSQAYRDRFPSTETGRQDWQA